MNLFNKCIFMAVFLWAGIGSAHSMDIYGLSEGVAMHSEYRKNLSQNELLREALFDLVIEKTLVSFSNKKHNAATRGYEAGSRINLRASSETMVVQYELTF